MLSSKHEEVRLQSLPQLRSFCRLGERAGLVEVVQALVDRRRYANATYLIFTQLPESYVWFSDGMGRDGVEKIMQAFASRKLAGLLPLLAEKHVWTDSADAAPAGLCFEIYPGEFLTIPEEVLVRAREILNVMLPPRLVPLADGTGFQSNRYWAELDAMIAQLETSE